MAFRTRETIPPEEWGSILVGALGCYDTITDTEDDWQWDRDQTLHNRSKYEFIREQLTDAQRTELDQVDSFWRAHPKEFNEAFGIFHYQSNKKTALTGFVEDENGETPAIPASHWWWRPIEEKEE